MLHLLAALLLTIGGSSGVRTVDAASTGGTLVPSSLVGGGEVSYSVLLNQNEAVGVPPVVTSDIVGIHLSFTFIQDATGYRSVSWGPGFSGVGRFMPRQGPGQSSWIDFVLDASGTWEMVGFSGIDTGKPFDIRDFGADTSLPDNSTAINNAITAAESAGAGSWSSQVYSPPGVLLLTSPVVIPGSKLALRGAGMFTGFLDSQSYVGPTIAVVGTSAGPPPTQASLATGPGVALTLSSGGGYKINFANTPNLKLDGLSAITVEFFLNATDTAGENVIYFGDPGLGGSLQPTHAPATTFAFDLLVSQARLTTGGVTHILAFSPSTGSTHHVALSYDGTTIRLFIDGVQTASIAATGTVTSSMLQDFVVGQLSGNVPQMNGLDEHMANGAIDGIRISKTARYTINFTAPTAKPTYDSNTLFLENWDQINGLLVGAHLFGNLQAWYVWQPGADALESNDIEISDMGFAGQSTGIWVEGSIQSTYKNLWFNNTYGALWLDGQNFGSVVEHIVASSLSFLANGVGWGSRFGIAIPGAGISRADDLTFNGFGVPLLTCGDMYIHNVYELPGLETVWPIAVVGDGNMVSGNSGGVTLDDMVFDWEDPNGALAGVYVQGVQTMTVKGGQYQMQATGAGLSAFHVENVGSLLLMDPEFAGAAPTDGGTEGVAFHVVSMPGSPTSSTGNGPISGTAYRFGSVVPAWTDPGNEQWVRITEPGVSNARDVAIATVADQNFSATFSNELIEYTSLTAPRIVQLPDPAPACKGRPVEVVENSSLNGASKFSVTVEYRDAGVLGSITTDGGFWTAYCNGSVWHAR